MPCRKAFDLDLVACLLDADRPEWTDFRDHYPRCPDCAAEVRTWTELQASLAPPHPSPEELYRFETDAPNMPLETRQAVLAHVTSCRACRDELRALRTFDPKTLPAATAAPAPQAAPRPRRRRWPSLRGVLLHPAFAYGIALAVALPTIMPRLRPLVAEQVAKLDDRRRPPVPAGSGPAGPAPAHVEAEGRRSDLDRSAPLAPPPATPASTGPAPAGVGQAGPAPGMPAAPPEPRPPAALHDAAEGFRQGAGHDERGALVAGREEAAPETDLLAAAPAQSADAPEERKADASDDWPVVVLTANREVAVQRPDAGLVLRLAPPRSLPALPAGLAWMRVRDADGRRELREQQLGNPGSNAEMRVPAPWLEPGSYRAELVLGDDTRPVVTARFRVGP
jgi:hypothetical protein